MNYLSVTFAILLVSILVGLVFYKSDKDTFEIEIDMSEPDISTALEEPSLFASLPWDQKLMLVVEKVKNVTLEVDLLEGEWDYLNSRGLWTKADDNYYMGNKDSQDYRSGLGAMALPNGDYYVGNWKANLRHGYGKTLTGYSIKETEEVYISEWKFDEPHGYGWYFTGEGHSYVGSFLCGQQDGFGVFSWSLQAPSRETDDADKPGFAANLPKFVESSSIGRHIHALYIGEWQLGAMHGAGIYENNQILHEGQWSEGKREGLAKITYKDTKQVVYRMFRNDGVAHEEEVGNEKGGNI